MSLNITKFLNVLLFLYISLLLIGCVNLSQSTSEIPNETSTPTRSVTRLPTNTTASTPTDTVIPKTPIQPVPLSAKAPFVIAFYYYDPSGITTDDNAQIYTMHLDGKIEQQLTAPNEQKVDYSHPAWSPDCQMIAATGYFGYYDDKHHESIVILDKDGNMITDIPTQYQRNSNPSWFSDGRRIAFDAWLGESSQIFIYDIDTKAITQITYEGSNVHPDWSPVNEKIVFESRRVEGYGYSIYIMNNDGSDQREIVPVFWGSDPSDFDHPGMVDPRDPRWSPDGSQIVFRVREDYQGNQVWKLYIMNRDGSNRHRLIEGDPHKFDLDDPDFYFIDEFDPVWSPDGKHIFFTRTSDYNDYTQICYAEVYTGNWSCLEDHYENLVVQGVDWCHGDQETGAK